MKKHYLLFIVCLLSIQVLYARERVSINEGWRFHKGNPAQQVDSLAYSLPGFNDTSWRTLNLPHDWGIEGPFNQAYPGETAKLPWWGTGWYRKNMAIPASDSGKRFYLDIDGAMSYSTVWCNGHLVGGWPYGYASFRLDLTPFVQPGKENVLAIRLENPEESSRWYPGGGIYRNVWLVKTGATHVAHWGTSVTTEKIQAGSATLQIQVAVDNHEKQLSPIQLKTEIFTWKEDGRYTGKPLVTDVSSELSLTSGCIVKCQLQLPNPQLWNIEKPHCYAAVTTIIQGNKELDRYVTPFGVRTIRFAPDGFYLNEKKLELQGVCMHHDHGALGAAFHLRAMERQLEILKEMGVNAIRTSHNPPAPEMLDLCDRMGFVVIDEAFDTWKMPKKKNGYSQLFENWHERDLIAMIRRDRNHPCVIMWSTGNEVGEQNTAEGLIISRQLTAIAHDEDPSRPVTSGCDNPQAGFNGFGKTFDVFGFNYKPHLYSKFHKENTNIPFYGSETASCISTRGEYLFPVGEDKSGGKIGFQMSSYDLYAPGWAMPPDWEFKGQDENPTSAGEFVWTGFDYLGEPTPFTQDMTVLTNYHSEAERAQAKAQLDAVGKLQVPSRSSYFGIVDLAGFKKDRFYIYQARWRPDFPMAHILPHWNWPERKGLITPVHVYTSGTSAELFLNGRSLGKREKQPYQYRLRWDSVVYEPGELKVISYKNGKKWAEDIVATTGNAVRLAASPDRKEMKADGSDLIYVTVRITDKNGTTVPRSNPLVRLEISGPAEIAATDNGDPTSHASFQSHSIKAFNGLCLVILRSKKGESGTIRLKAVAEDLETATIVAKANK